MRRLICFLTGHADLLPALYFRLDVVCARCGRSFSPGREVL